MTNPNLLDVPDVQILWRTPGVVSASVRDGSSGVHDVRWARSTGWSCSCNEVGGRCAHVLAVERLTAGERA